MLAAIPDRLPCGVILTTSPSDGHTASPLWTAPLPKSARWTDPHPAQVKAVVGNTLQVFDDLAGPGLTATAAVTLAPTGDHVPPSGDTGLGDFTWPAVTALLGTAVVLCIAKINWRKRRFTRKAAQLQPPYDRLGDLNREVFTLDGILRPSQGDLEVLNKLRADIALDAPHWRKCGSMSGVDGLIGKYVDATMELSRAHRRPLACLSRSALADLVIKKHEASGELRNTIRQARDWMRPKLTR